MISKLEGVRTSATPQGKSVFKYYEGRSHKSLSHRHERRKIRESLRKSDWDISDFA